jgi:hypothetical protein
MTWCCGFSWWLASILPRWSGYTVKIYLYNTIGLIYNKAMKKKSTLNNPVAKHARKFNKHAVHRDRKNDYQRNAKHRKLSVERL